MEDGLKDIKQQAEAMVKVLEKLYRDLGRQDTESWFVIPSDIFVLRMNIQGRIKLLQSRIQGDSFAPSFKESLKVARELQEQAKNYITPSDANVTGDNQTIDNSNKGPVTTRKFPKSIGY